VAVSRLVGLPVVCFPHLFFVFLLLLQSFPGAVGMLAPRVGVLLVLFFPPHTSARSERAGRREARTLAINTAA
jgi:hypothetical protein